MQKMSNKLTLIILSIIVGLLSVIAVSLANPVMVIRVGFMAILIVVALKALSEFFPKRK